MNIYIVYGLDVWQKNLLDNLTLKNCLKKSYKNKCV